jgi:RimJ/RimL family protein N-acetyltransferase
VRKPVLPQLPEGRWGLISIDSQAGAAEVSGSAIMRDDAARREVTPMKFLPTSFDIPEALRTANLYARPLVEEDLELDYDAIMSSQDMLRAWGWPYDLETYTKEVELQALIKDRKIHVAHGAFCYAIMNPKDSYCFGSVYIQPLIDELQEALARMGEHGVRKEYGAEVSFWVRETLTEQGFDLVALDEIAEWLRQDWPFDRVLFSATTANRRQISLLGSRGFPLVYEADDERTIGKLYKWGSQRFYMMNVARNVNA